MRAEITGNKKLKQLIQILLDSLRGIEKAIYNRHFPYADDVLHQDSQVQELFLEISKEMTVLCEDEKEQFYFSETLTNLRTVWHYIILLARLTFQINEEPQLKAYVDFPRLSEAVIRILETSIDLFLKGKPEEVEWREQQKNDIKALDEKLVKDIQILMKKTANNVNRGVNLILAANYFIQISECGFRMVSYINKKK
jgi:phosphate transport system protein